MVCPIRPLIEQELTDLQRVPGADMNCHFTLAALIGLGMYGMKNKLELDIPPIGASGQTCVECSLLWAERHFV